MKEKLINLSDNTPEVYTLLQNIDVFNSVYIDYGCTVWNDGEIDIAPEYLYENSIDVADAVNA